LKWLELLRRLLEGAINAFNRQKKRDYTDNVSDAIANGGRVRKSDKSFSELADQSERNNAD
jgi:hypothetical protein